MYRGIINIYEISHKSNETSSYVSLKQKKKEINLVALVTDRIYSRDREIDNIFEMITRIHISMYMCIYVYKMYVRAYICRCTHYMH